MNNLLLSVETSNALQTLSDSSSQNHYHSEPMTYSNRPKNLFLHDLCIIRDICECCILYKVSFVSNPFPTKKESSSRFFPLPDIVQDLVVVSTADKRSLRSCAIQWIPCYSQGIYSSLSIQLNKTVIYGSYRQVLNLLS